MAPLGAWSLVDHRGRPIPHAVHLHTDHPASKLAVVLPGLRYSCQAPLLFYLAKLLFETGHDALTVDFTYGTNDGFTRAGDAERADWLRRDALAVHESLRSREQYHELVLAGKSLGTHHMLHLFRAGRLPDHASLIWLTPALSPADMGELAVGLRNPSLFLVGTRDHFYDAPSYERLLRNPRVSVELFEGADHGLEVGDEVQAAIAGLSRCLSVVRSFLETRRTP